MKQVGLRLPENEYAVPIPQRVAQLKVILSIIMPVLALMGLLNYAQGHRELALVEAVVMLLVFLPALLVPSATMLKDELYLNLGELLLLTGSAVIFIMLIHDGGISGTGMLWVPIFAFEAFYFRGIRRGWYWIIGFGIGTIIALSVLGSYYSNEELWMFLPAFGFYILLAYLTNRYRLLNARRLDEKVRERTARLEHLAMHDSLTDLPNRTALIHHTQKLIDHNDGSPLSIVIINCSRFQEINNLLGHENGDMMLKQMANRLQAFAGDHMFAARLAGDEFAIALQSEDELSDAIALRELMEEPYSISHDHIEIETRIGLARYPQHGKTPEELLRHADIALRTAKTIKKSPMIYSDDQNPYSIRRLELFGQLRNAIRNHELVLYFQPKVNLASGRIVAAEALVRWMHPHEGMVAPGEFIGIAEETGLMRPMTQWIIQQAIAQQSQWIAQDIEISIGVNLSMLDLTDPSFPASIKHQLIGHQAVKKLMTLEITESAFMNFPDIALKVIRELAELGFRISIDDYGTGYSSLSYLQNMPVDELKIDQSFVFNMLENPKSEAIVRSTIELAHNLDLEVVAEGIETPAAAARLKELGCDLGQGFGLGRPMPADDLEKLYRKQQHSREVRHEQA